MTTDPGLQNLLIEMRANAALPLEQAKAIPAQAYRSSAFHELEKKTIFANEWHCIGREDLFKNIGDYSTFKIVDEPVAVLRCDDSELHAYSNICRHRMAPLLEGSGNVKKNIVCPYHAWTYNLHGQLIAAAHMSKSFDPTPICLPEFKIEIWKGWVYVSLAKQPAPLAPRLESLAARIENYQPEKYQTLFYVDEIWDTNWKSLYENFSESYHVFRLHPDTIEGAQPTRLTDTSFDNDDGFYYYEQCRNPNSDTAYPGHTVISNSALGERQRLVNPMITIYPTHAFAISPERMFWMSLQPESVGQLRVRWGINIYPGAIPPDWTRDEFIADIRSISESVNAEDKTMLEETYRNAASAHVETAQISPLERTTWEFQRYLVRMMDKGLGLAHSAA